MGRHLAVMFWCMGIVCCWMIFYVKTTREQDDKPILDRFESNATLARSTNPPRIHNRRYPPPYSLGRRGEGYQMIINMPPCWYVKHEIGETSPPVENMGIGPDMPVTFSFSQPGGMGIRLAVGAIKGGMNDQGTVVMDDTSELTTWECIAGWAASPTKEVTLSIPPDPTYTALMTDGDAYVACMTPVPTAQPSSVVPPPSATTGDSSSGSPDHSQSTVRGDIISTESSSTGEGVLGGNVAPTSLSENTNSPPSSATTASADPTALDDTYQGRLWLNVPEPTVSVHPLDPQVGDWNAAGPFWHVFDFHAWVPTYLFEVFEVYTKPVSTDTWVSAAKCTIGISHKPTGGETATFTVTGVAPFVTPSGEVNGAYMRC